MEEVKKKLGLFSTQWSEGKLSPAVQQKMQALTTGYYSSALGAMVWCTCSHDKCTVPLMHSRVDFNSFTILYAIRALKYQKGLVL